MLLGQAWSWGNNEFGQLGQGDNRHRRVPVPVSGTGPGGHTIVSVSLGQSCYELLQRFWKGSVKDLI